MSEIEQSKDLTVDERKNEFMHLRMLRRQQNEMFYKKESFATVITGATEISSLVIDHYRGIPPILARKAELKSALDTKYANRNVELERILFIGKHLINPTGEERYRNQSGPSVAG